MANGYTRQKGTKLGRTAKCKVNVGGCNSRKDGRSKVRNSAGKRGKSGSY